jgi:hypothetical protein
MAAVKSWRVKVERAKQHLDEFGRIELAYMMRRPYDVSPDFDPYSSEHIGNVRVREPVPPMLAAIAGDLLNNLRSALDHIAVALIGRKEAAFPIYTIWNGEKSKDFEREVRGANAAAIAGIRELQPCQHAARNTPVGEHPLAVLQVLNNKDKHRALTIVATRGTVNSLRIRSETGGEVFIRNLTIGRTTEMVETEAEFFRYDVSGENVKVESRFTFEIAFNEDGAVKGKKVTEILRALIEYVTLVLDRLEPMVP